MTSLKINVKKQFNIQIRKRTLLGIYNRSNNIFKKNKGHVDCKTPVIVIQILIQERKKFCFVLIASLRTSRQKVLMQLMQLPEEEEFVLNRFLANNWSNLTITQNANKQLLKIHGTKIHDKVSCKTFEVWNNIDRKTVFYTGVGLELQWLQLKYMSSKSWWSWTSFNRPTGDDSLFSLEDIKNFIENRKKQRSNLLICCLISFYLFILFILYFKVDKHQVHKTVYAMYKVTVCTC